MGDGRTNGPKYLGALDLLFLGTRVPEGQDVGFFSGQTCLVQKEQKILSWGEDNSAREPLHLLFNENVQCDEQNNTIISRVCGYPFLVLSREKTGMTLSVTVLPLFTVSSDAMFVTMHLFPGSGAGNISADMLHDLLAAEGIVFGIDGQAIAEAVQRCNQGHSVENIVVARGVLPLHGKDAWFRFEVETGPCAGTLLGNGKIDFRERKVFIGVEKDQLIAMKISPTEGTCGYTVFREKIAARPGKDLKVMVSGDVAYSSETHEVRALCAGILVVANNNAIRVQAKQVIAGDVDYQTGNVKSGNSVEVSGSIKPGFSVIAKGDIVVGGNIAHAIVQTRANAIVKGGLLGAEGQIKARGDVDISFVEHGSILAGGTVLLRKEGYYSKIRASGAIHCPETSRILGGQLLSSRDISCGMVGSGNAAPLILAAGVDPSRYGIWQDLQQRAALLHEQLSLYLQHRGEAGKSQRKYIRMHDEFAALKKRMDHFNLIPGTSEDSLQEPFMNICDSIITVHGDIAMGTGIRIGNLVLCLTRNLRSVTFALDTTHRQIVMTPL